MLILAIIAGIMLWFAMGCLAIFLMVRFVPNYIQNANTGSMPPFILVASLWPITMLYFALEGLDSILSFVAHKSQKAPKKSDDELFNEIRTRFGLEKDFDFWSVFHENNATHGEI